jgi:hypothetical protein
VDAGDGREHKRRRPPVEALGEGGARLTPTLDMRGLLTPIIAHFYKGLTDRYMNLEAEGMKRAVEAAKWGLSPERYWTRTEPRPRRLIAIMASPASLGPTARRVR